MLQAKRASTGYFLMGIGVGWIWGVVLLPVLMLSLFPRPVEAEGTDDTARMFVPVFLMAAGAFLSQSARNKDAEGSDGDRAPLPRE